MQPLDKWNIVFVGVKEDLARKTTFYFTPCRLPGYEECKWDENFNIDNLYAKIKKAKNRFRTPDKAKHKNTS